jgi:predicted CoA-binding protein
MSIEVQAKDFLAQKRIAVVGVSRQQGTGNAIFKALRRRGFETVPVNPNVSEVEGETCYPDLKSIPGGVDAAVVVTRPEVTERVVRDCVEAGISRVWMHHNALFGARTSSVSEAATAYGREHGVEMIAGGCPLMFGDGADLGHRCMRWLLRVTHRLP